MFEYNKLRGRIVEKYRTVVQFAEAIGRSEVSVSRKINGKSQFNQADIMMWCKALDIEPLDIGSYFFA